MMEMDNFDIWKVAGGRRAQTSDQVISETEVIIRLNGRRYRRLHCLNSHLEELALGYFLAEGLAGPSDIHVDVKGSEILVLGAAYKPDIDDLRESPALDVIGLLEQKGATVKYHDPYVPVIRADGHHMLKEMHSVPDMMAAVKAADCVVIITNHKVYDYPGILEAAQCIVDTRNALGKTGRESEKVTRL